MRALVRAQAGGRRRGSGPSPLPNAGAPSPERRVEAQGISSRARSRDLARASPPPAPPSHGHAQAHHPHGHAHHLRALVLDATYRPIDVVPWTRAVCLDLMEKAEVVSYYEHATVRSATRAHPVPAVLRSRAVVAWGSARGPAPALTRRNILARDGGRCAYCGRPNAATVDHVVPASKGGERSWTNLVACCQGCNQAKGARTLAQLGWSLRHQPRRPAAAEWAAAMAAARGTSGGSGGSDGRRAVGSAHAQPPPEWAAYLATSQGSLLRSSASANHQGDAAAAA